MTVKLPEYQGRRIRYRYVREKRRLLVSGSDRDYDIGAMRGLILRGVIPADLDAITHTTPSGIVSIYRGNHLRP